MMQIISLSNQPYHLEINYVALSTFMDKGHYLYILVLLLP